MSDYIKPETIFSSRVKSISFFFNNIWSAVASIADLHWTVADSIVLPT